ncbi:MAG: hypothetical protein ACP5HU_12030 [Phycisphaerae bacterium]
MRNLKLKLLVSLATGALVAGCAAGTDAERTQPSAEPNQPAATTRPPENLERMLLDRPSVPVIVSEDGPVEQEEEPDLPPEGTMVIDQPGRLRDRSGDWVLLEFTGDRAAGLPEVIRVLPCELLERMEELADSRQRALFRVSGEVTRHEDHAYLLPRKATLEAPPQRSVEQVTTEPTTRPVATAPAERTASPDEIIGKLLQEQPGKPVLPVETDTEGQGRFVIDRLIRIVPDERGRWHLARFESDNTLSDRPMRLLPCRALEQAMEVFDEHETPPPFHVSGEVTRYRGDTYLLPRKLVLKRGLGRF